MALTRSSSAAYVASQVAKTSSGGLVALHVYNSKGSAQFIQLHDAAVLPADAAVPMLTLTMATVANLTLSWPAPGLPFTAGLVICNSSTGPTKTIGSADCYITAVVS